jgi:hypothetical protein
LPKGQAAKERALAVEELKATFNEAADAAAADDGFVDLRELAGILKILLLRYSKVALVGTAIRLLTEIVEVLTTR